MNRSSCLSYCQQVFTSYFHRRTSEQIRGEFLIALLQIHRHQRIQDSRHLVAWLDVDIYYDRVKLYSCDLLLLVESTLSCEDVLNNLCSNCKLDRTASSFQLASLQYLSDKDTVGCEMVLPRMSLNVRLSKKCYSHQKVVAWKTYLSQYLLSRNVFSSFSSYFVGHNIFVVLPWLFTQTHAATLIKQLLIMSIPVKFMNVFLVVWK